MEFKLEIGGYETVFPQYEIYEQPEINKVIFNFLDLTSGQYDIFCSAKIKKIFIEEENNIICFRCVNENLQFSIRVDKSEKK